MPGNIAWIYLCQLLITRKKSNEAESAIRHVSSCHYERHFKRLSESEMFLDFCTGQAVLNRL